MAEEFTATLVDGFEYEECDLELLELILRGDIGGASHPLVKLTFIDDDDTEVDISSKLKNITITLRRDDRRTDLSLLAPPIASLSATLENIDKSFTPGAGGTFAGKLAYGRVVKASIGYIIGETRCLFLQGEFITDDPSFDVSPGAVLSLSARDKLSLALDRQISMRSFASISAESYIKEILTKIGIITSGPNSEVDITVATTLTNVLAITNKRAIDILSDVIIFLQTEAPFRLIQIEGKIKLVQVPTSGFANVVFHFKRDLKNPFGRRDRSNQSRVATTVTQTGVIVSTTDDSLVTDSGVRSDLPKSLSHLKAVHKVWFQGVADTVKLKEVKRDTFGLDIDAADTGAPTDTWSITVRGDRTSSIAGEAGPGINQGGVGQGMKDAEGNELNALLIRRGKTVQFDLSFIETSLKGQNLADVLQIRFGAPFREMTLHLAFANPILKINDLFRVVEKYSNDLSLYHLGEISHTFIAGKNVKLTSRMVGQFANVIEPPQLYDKSFLYNQGRIYDERFGVGNKDEEDLAFRGAVVTRTRP